VSNLVEIRDLQFAYGARHPANLRMDFPARKWWPSWAVPLRQDHESSLIGGRSARNKAPLVGGEVVHQLDNDGCTACAARRACCSSSAPCLPT
jgi:hypothetical protein